MKIDCLRFTLFGLYFAIIALKLVFCCRNSDDCGENECCIKRGRFGYWRSGLCRKFSTEGESCSYPFEIIYGKYTKKCPCRKGLICDSVFNFFDRFSKRCKPERRIPPPLTTTSSVPEKLQSVETTLAQTSDATTVTSLQRTTATEAATTAGQSSTTQATVSENTSSKSEPFHETTQSSTETHHQTSANTEPSQETTLSNEEPETTTADQSAKSTVSQLTTVSPEASR